MQRLDMLLVEKGFCETRNQAQSLIKSGNVKVNDRVVKKCGEGIKDDSIIKVDVETLKYVSRGGFKLERAIKEFKLNLENKIVLDIGSSTGGFCDCALQNGAKQVIAVDVGSNQLHKKLRENENVLVFENTDIRDFNLPEGLMPEILVGDLSFISLKKIIPKFSEFNTIKEFILLIKPQFECGLEIAKKFKGVIKDTKVHQDILFDIWKTFESENLKVENLTYSSILGGDGNIEYLIYVKREKVKSLEEKKIKEQIEKITELAKSNLLKGD